MAFEKEKADVKETLKNLEKGEPIFLAHVAIIVKDNSKTGKIKTQVSVDLAGAPSPVPLEKVIKVVDVMREAIIVKWGEKK